MRMLKQQSPFLRPRKWVLKAQIHIANGELTCLNSFLQLHMQNANENTDINSR